MTTHKEVKSDIHNLNRDAEQSASYDASYDGASASQSSRSISNTDSSGRSLSIPTQSTPVLNQSLYMTSPEKSARALNEISGQPPIYSELPTSPMAVSPLAHRPGSHDSFRSDLPLSPLNESLNIPIPQMARYSLNLPEPVESSIPSRDTLSFDSLSEATSTAATSIIPSITLGTSLVGSTSSDSNAKPKSRTVRIANSMRRKPTTKTKEPFPLPQNPEYAFSASGHTLLLWGKHGNHIARFDIPGKNSLAIQGCRYDVTSIETAAAGTYVALHVVHLPHVFTASLASYSFARYDARAWSFILCN